MTKLIIPEKALTQHIAAIGKTGGGKTSTIKLLIEHIVAQGGRVCVLDPIKSDYWGLTSSVTGKSAGLPFRILGGPRGHVPLHAKAGAAIGEIVANGSLPLSILDMADFEMGGLQEFFVHFAPMLLKKMRGVLHLVIEEAHEFAPKERAGFGNEAMAIHYAKKLAQAGRSKGIPLIVATQRTQALHNALLGSCDTMIAHRLTAPADQEPVVKWLKANLPADKAKEVSASLQSLQTGEAWVCSGELAHFERQQFPRISTYDNTATPDANTQEIEVKTAPVDKEELLRIVGSAVEEAKANDPAALKKRIAELEKQLAKPAPAAAVALPAVPLPPIEVSVYSEDDKARSLEFLKEIQNLHDIVAELPGYMRNLEGDVKKHHEEILRRVTPRPVTHRPAVAPIFPRNHTPVARHANIVAPEKNGILGRAERSILLAINSRHPRPCNRSQAAVLSGYSINSSSFSNALSTLRTGGYIDGPGDNMNPTQLGLDMAPVNSPITIQDLQGRWMQKLQKAERAILQCLIEEYPNPVSKTSISDATGYSETSSSFSNALSTLRTLELITRDAEPRATEILFEP